MSGLDMTEAHSPNLSFAEAARQAEEAARAADGEPIAPAAAEAPAAPEAPAATEPEAPAAEPAPVETPDERDARIAALEAQLAEKDAFIGRQSNEVGELRRTIDERLSQIDQRLDTPAPPRMEITPDLVEQNPAYAAELAYQQGNMATVEIAITAWKDQDPFAASAWFAQKLTEEKVAEERARHEAELREVRQQLAPLAEATANDELRRGVEVLPAETRAFLANSEAVQALATEYPAIGEKIVSGSPAERLNAVKALHDIHRGRTADTLASSTQEVARQTALEAQQARDDAHVASAATASQEEPKTREQIEQEAAVAAFTRPRGIWADGFVRPGKQ